MVLTVGETHLILELPVDQPVPAGRLRDDVRLADDAGRRHPERPEDPLLQKIAIELAGHPVNENAERQVAEVAVAPARCRAHRPAKWPRRSEKLLFGVVLRLVEFRG